MRVLALSLLVTLSLDAQYTQQGSRLRAFDGVGAALGTSLAISADGNTAIAGGPTDHSQTGAAWIFTRNGKVWTQQGAMLHGTGSIADQAQQGTSVAMSADGNTVLIGGPRDRCDCPFDGTYPGATWVFTRTAGVWTQQGDKLFGSGANGSAEQGSSVALSADGNTAIIGGPLDNSGAGAAWIFTRSGDAWTQEGSKLVGISLTGTSGRGYSVAISGDGNTVLIGAPSGVDGGSAFLFTRDGGGWTQQSQFIGFGGVSQPGSPLRFGASVALSYDGTTAMVGGPGDSTEVGAAWVFVPALNGEWAMQGPKLTGTTENNGGRQGTSVSLSADGNTAVIGGPLDHPEGAVWVFTRSQLGAWSQQSKLVGSGAMLQYGSPQHGKAVAISADATTIVEGGFGQTTGAMWPFAKPVPTIATHSGNLQSAETSTAFSPLAVSVRDAADQPSSNASVTFAIHSGPSGASGSFASSATVLTNANGIATAPTLTANAVLGGFTVTATTPAAPATALFDLTNAPIAAPTNLVATATAIPSIVVSWSPVSGATSYEVMRSSNFINYTQIVVTSDTSFTDTTQIFNGSYYFYKVRVISPSVSSFSAHDLATIVTFTDPSLTGLPVKMMHFFQLRDGVTRVRAAAGLWGGISDDPYTDLHLSGLPVKAIHLVELRTLLDEARARLLLPPLIYSRPAITAGSTVIAASDVLELRAGVQ